EPPLRFDPGRISPHALLDDRPAVAPRGAVELRLCQPGPPHAAAVGDDGAATGPFLPQSHVRRRPGTFARRHGPFGRAERSVRPGCLPLSPGAAAGAE